jgi:2-polyprenyl-3-methyl-5-hydroxy-6-metoxy-1,4-benzoquinol methylase
MIGENNDHNKRHADRAAQRVASRQRRVWSRRVSSWDQHGSANLGTVTSAVVGVAAARAGAQVLDLGCGTGQVSIPLALAGASVLGVDVSPAMASRLKAEARQRGLQSLTVMASPIEQLDLPPASFDLVVSSYALHHLRDPDKASLISAAHGWLRPGGQIVIADMMLGRGASARDRAIIRSKLTVLARKGPGGWWRIAKNAVRYLLRVQERPISMSAWTALLRGAGFTSISASAIVAEAGLVTGFRHPLVQSVASAQAARADPSYGRS